MKRYALIIFAMLVAGGTSARAQSASPSATGKPKDATAAEKAPPHNARDSVTIADVQRAADELARTVQEAVKQITENPELKVAALRLATNAVNAAQVVVTQQAATLQATLEQLAKEVAAVSAPQTRPKTH
jgi:hypothetical protein